MSKVISRTNKMVPFDCTLLNDPIVVASSGGVITEINEKFTGIYGWSTDEIVGQNVHMLIPSKFIRKNVHDKKMEAYSYGQNSEIIGKTRIVPICTPDDNEILSTIKLIPIKSKKEHCFLVCLDKIDLTNDLFNFQLEFKHLQTLIANINKFGDGWEEGQEEEKIAIEISRIFSKELELLAKFIVENQNSPSVVAMTRYFLVQKPIGKLGILKKVFERTFNNESGYLSVLCKRIIFPAISYKVRKSVLDNIQNQIVEQSSDEDTLLA